MEHVDEHQQHIIEMHGHASLVLAGPGCGKTHILAKRVFYAHAQLGIPYTDMLCVTFTNRAAREMQQRIEAYSGCRPSGLFIGNIHRFCLRFLHQNGIIKPETSVLDEEDQREFLMDVLGMRTANEIKDFLYKKAYIYQRDCDHPAWVMRHPSSEISVGDFKRIELYRDYLDDNGLIDFDDILLTTYTALLQAKAADYDMARYHWIQVDEVQDMTPLQLAIIERITAKIDRTVLYLGDEQQAIFSFTGAGGRALDALKGMCEGNIERLRRNYRAPSNMVAMCNLFASTWLNLAPEFLPEAFGGVPDAELVSFTAPRQTLPSLVVKQAKDWLKRCPGEQIAVLVRTNYDGDKLSEYFAGELLEHFHISKQDVFHQIPFKTVWSHLAVVQMPAQTQPWARLLYQTRSVRTLSGARRLVKLLRDNAVAPQELLDIDNPGVVELFTSICNSHGQTIVVFDTESTGLDIFADDIVQIAAIKICDGKIVEGSEFEIFIESHRPLPPTLADGMPNPMTEVYAAATKHTPSEAFNAFIEYCGPWAVLAGHNLHFDLPILRNNISRRTDIELPPALEEDAVSIDTLDLSYLLFPRIKSHKLKDMLEYLGAEGANTHLASDDARATASLLLALKPKAFEALENINKVKLNTDVRRAATRFSLAYADFYNKSRAALLRDEGNLALAISEAASFFHTNEYTGAVDRLDYIMDLVEQCVVDPSEEHNLRNQLAKHLFELVSFSEADLFINGIVRERLSIMTIHKAKGLEWDNVIVFDISNTFGSATEAARLLYVAFSRAKKRLTVGIGGHAPRQFTPISPFFRNINF